MEFLCFRHHRADTSLHLRISVLGTQTFKVLKDGVTDYNLLKTWCILSLLRVFEEYFEVRFPISVDVLISVQLWHMRLVNLLCYESVAGHSLLGRVRVVALSV